MISIPTPHAVLARAKTPRAYRVAIRATLIVALVVALAPVFPAAAQASTWTVNTTARTEADIRLAWDKMKPAYSGLPYAVAPSTVAPYAPGQAASGFIGDGLRTINFARYLAGLPADVVTTSALNWQAQHGAVLLAASTFSHTPSQPADMTKTFYDHGFASTSQSNIGYGHKTSASFQKACLADASASNISRVGHRRWLLNPPLKQTGISVAETRMTTYVLDRSRTEAVAYTKIAWPAEGLFPIEFFSAQTPWSITLNPAKYDWEKTGHRVTLKRLSDSKTWSFSASNTNTSGTYFNADFAGYGVSNAFIFRPDPASVSYKAGDVFEVTLSGGIYAAGTKTPATVTYRTTFMSLDAPIAWPAGVTPVEIAGANRIATAIESSKLAFPSGAKTVVVATAYDWPDALGGAALAGTLAGPILLTSPTSLPDEVAGEIKRLGATDAIILGGTNAVGSKVQTSLATALGGSDRVTRVAGTNRYDTARQVAAKTVERLKATPGGYCGTAFVATGANFPDALGASPLAAANGWPIYLVSPAGLDRATVSAMNAAGVNQALILGGSAAVPGATVTTLSSELGCTTKRISGADRYETALAVASYGVSQGGLCWSRLAIATGGSFPDALAGGVLQGGCGSVVILTPSTSLNSSVKKTLGDKRGTITEVRFLGGTGALSQYVRDSVAVALR